MSSEPSAVEVSDRVGDAGDSGDGEGETPEPSSANAPGGLEFGDGVDVVMRI